jgi:hypothetical protein
VNRAALDNDPAVLAVAIRVFSPGQAHVGIAYRDNRGNDSMSLLHLATYCDLRVDLDATPTSGGYVWFVPRLPLDAQKFIATRCRAIAKQKPLIRYGFSLNPTCFFDPDGTMHSLPGTGLTCATFVLRVFSTCRWPLVDEGTWPVRQDDEARFRDLHQEIQRHAELLCLKFGLNLSDESKYIDHMADELPCVRIRPEEVAAACEQLRLPAVFAQCEPAGRALIAKLAAESTRPQS